MHGQVFVMGYCFKTVGQKVSNVEGQKEKEVKTKINVGMYLSFIFYIHNLHVNKESPH